MTTHLVGPITVAGLPAELTVALDRAMGAVDASAWLADAVPAVNELLARWTVTPTRVLTGGAMSLCVHGVTADGEPVVVKVPADTDTGVREVAALTAWAGAGVPDVLAVNTEPYGFLMTYLRPDGTTPSFGQVIDLAARLHDRSSAHTGDLAPLEDELAGRLRSATERLTEPAYAPYADDVAAAANMFTRLLVTTTNPVAVHGDYQAKNLINTATGLHAIDPRTAVGDRTSDAALWVAAQQTPMPLERYLTVWRATQPASTYDRFLIWVWAYAVCERRTYPHLGYQERCELIDEWRDTAKAAASRLT